MTTLAWHDLQWCLRRAPRQLLAAMKKHGPSLMVAGGYIRACVTNEHVNDVDCFCPSKDVAFTIAKELVEGDEKRIHETPNALTLRRFRMPIQFIYRWTFETPTDAILSFDFTIARAAFWWKIEPQFAGSHSDKIADGKWETIIDERFYADVAGKRLIYCAPIRNEDAGGSLLRVLKFYQRGYRIPLDSLGAVLARMMNGVDDAKVEALALVMNISKEQRLADVLTGLLREVDPSLDPRHIAHLPSESARDKQVGEQAGAEGDE